MEKGPMWKEKVEIKAVLGKGNFGQVLKAEYGGTEVAVKEVCVCANCARDASAEARM